MITAKWIMGNDQLDDAKSIRTEVFVKEQGFSAEREFDDMDARAMHVIIYHNDIPSATGRLYYDNSYKIGRIAVIKAKRGLRLGDLTVRMLLFKAFDQEAEQVTVISQLPAVGFYEKFGFASTGKQTEDEGVPHLVMTVTPQTAKLSGDCSQCANKDKCTSCNN